jgi:hypothetical protein
MRGVALIEVRQIGLFSYVLDGYLAMISSFTISSR